MAKAKKKTARAQGAAEIVTDRYAAQMHDAWRKQFHKANPKEKALPRMRERGGAMVDINQPWARLDPRAKQDNLIAARTAYEAVQKFPNDREAAADYIHKQWIARNKGDKNQPRDLFKPYAKLPEAEKDKDRVHYDRMKKALAALRKTPAKKPAKKAAAAPALAFAAKDWRKIDSARKRLSAALGREVSAEALLLAGAEAMAALAASLSAKPKNRR